MQRFCLHFVVSRIKDLPANRVAEAYAFVRQALAAPATDDQPRVDPFA
jgi:hypothetical protein